MAWCITLNNYNYTEEEYQNILEINVGKQVGAEEILHERQETKRKESFMKKELRPWQIEAVKKLEEQDDRKILFVVDREGNTGKTFLANWLEAVKQARVLSNMASADAKYLMESEDQFVVFDLVRSSLDYVNYGCIEEIKNGCFTSTKNECRRKVYERVMKVVVFMNQYPDETKLSKDRWDIMDLDKEKVEGLRQHASSSQGERPGTPRSVVSQASEDSAEKIINQIDNLLASYN